VVDGAWGRITAAGFTQFQHYAAIIEIFSVLELASLELTTNRC